MHHSLLTKEEFTLGRTEEEEDDEEEERPLISRREDTRGEEGGVSESSRVRR